MQLVNTTENINERDFKRGGGRGGMVQNEKLQLSCNISEIHARHPYQKARGRG